MQLTGNEVVCFPAAGHAGQNISPQQAWLDNRLYFDFYPGFSLPLYIHDDPLPPGEKFGLE